MVRTPGYIMTVVMSAAMVLSVACSSSEETDLLPEEIEQHTSTKALRVGVVPIEECLPVTVAQHLGLLDSLHADVLVKRYDALSECKAAKEKGEIDVMVEDSTIAFTFLTSKKSRIHRISQLSDKVIAADGDGYSTKLAYEAIDSLLKQKRHVFVIRVEDLSVRTRMLMTGNVDAALLPEPWATMAKKAGAYEVEGQRSKVKGRRSEGLSKKFREALRVASDSIDRYGKENYAYTLDK